jgi:hypothetical protein
MAMAYTSGDGLLDAVFINNKLMNKCKKIKQTHHHVHKLSDGLNEGPDPFAIGLWVDGAGICTNNQATQALLRVYFQKV